MQCGATSIMSPLPARRLCEPVLFPDSLIVGSRALAWGCFRVFALLPEGSQALGFDANLAVLGNTHEPEPWTSPGPFSGSSGTNIINVGSKAGTVTTQKLVVSANSFALAVLSRP